MDLDSKSLRKSIPFKCRNGHVTIKTFLGTTPNQIQCEGCLELLKNDKSVKIGWKKETFSLKDLIAWRI